MFWIRGRKQQKQIRERNKMAVVEEIERRQIARGELPYREAKLSNPSLLGSRLHHTHKGCKSLWGV